MKNLNPRLSLLWWPKSLLGSPWRPLSSGVTNGDCQKSVLKLILQLDASHRLNSSWHKIGRNRIPQEEDAQGDWWHLGNSHTLWWVDEYCFSMRRKSPHLSKEINQLHYLGTLLDRSEVCITFCRVKSILTFHIFV